MKKARKKKPSRAEIVAEQELGEIEALLERLGVPVVYDRRLEGRGGACRVRGERRLILQRGLPPSEKIDLILEGLLGMDLSGADVPESVQRRLEGIERARAAVPGGATSSSPSPEECSGDCSGKGKGSRSVRRRRSRAEA